MKKVDGRVKVKVLICLELNAKNGVPASKPPVALGKILMTVGIRPEVLSVHVATVLVIVQIGIIIGFSSAFD